MVKAAAVRTAIQQDNERTVEAGCEEAGALEAAGRLDDAEAILGRVIQDEQASAPALHRAALLSLRRQRPREAAERWERAVTLAPENAIFRRNLCEVYRTQGQLDEALVHGLRAIDLTPDEPHAHYNLGILYYDRMEIAAAIHHCRRALELEPSMIGAHFELAEALLVSGQFREGWQEYEYRFSLPTAPALLPEGKDVPLWGGKPMPEGTLLLIGDQGFGDTIQFCRYIPDVARRCPNLAVAASAEMLPLIRQQAGGAHSSQRWEDLPEFQAWCPLSSLPRLFGTDLSNIPAPIPYLTPDPEKVAAWRQRLDTLVPEGYRRIGIVWAGRPTHGNDRNRSMKLRALDALARKENVALISLQKGASQSEIGQYFGPAPLVNLGAEIDDFGDTMAVLASIERLITVDTSVAHLAGAMGRPVSVLLPFASDWRWLMGCTDTPWYPGMTLCRQTAPGDWDSAVALMLHTLDLGA